MVKDVPLPGSVAFDSGPAVGFILTGLAPGNSNLEISSGVLYHATGYLSLPSGSNPQDFAEARMRYNYELGYYGGTMSAVRTPGGAPHLEALVPSVFPGFSTYHIFFTLPEPNDFIVSIVPMPTYTMAFDLINTLCDGFSQSPGIPALAEIKDQNLHQKNLLKSKCCNTLGCLQDIS